MIHRRNELRASKILQERAFVAGARTVRLGPLPDDVIDRVLSEPVRGAVAGEALLRCRGSSFSPMDRKYAMAMRLGNSNPSTWERVTARRGLSGKAHCTPLITT